MTLDERIISLELRVAALEAAGLPPADALKKGKYSGKSSKEIAAKFPDYVAWCYDKGLAQGIGFTEADIKAAYDLLGTAGVIND